MRWLFLPRKWTLILILAILVLLPSVTSQSTLSVNVSTNKAEYSAGETVSISGRIFDNQNNPVPGATVSVEVDDPNSKIVEAQLVYSDQSGSYSDSFILPTGAVQGQYTVFVSASKSGFDTARTQTMFSVSSQTLSTTSSSRSTTQTSPPPSKCFIATATYGSELSPEVTLLRNFRDYDVLRTSAGRSFMIAFNTIYYSFSPQVAAFIVPHDSLRAAMKIILYPLIGVLYLSNRLFELLPFNLELGVILSGIFAAFGIGAVYVGPIAAMGRRLAKSHPSSSQMAAEAALFSALTSLGMLMFAEAVRLGPLLVSSTVATVLSFLCLGGFSISSIVEKKHRSA